MGFGLPLLFCFVEPICSCLPRCQVAPRSCHWHVRWVTKLQLRLDTTAATTRRPRQPFKDKLFGNMLACLPPGAEDNIMVARTWNLLDQSAYPLLLECEKRGALFRKRFFRQTDAQGNDQLCWVDSHPRNQSADGSNILCRFALGAGSLYVQ